jgi:hypothetical protein
LEKGHDYMETQIPRNLLSQLPLRALVDSILGDGQSPDLATYCHKITLVEAAGIEPASEEAAANVTTCVVRGDFSSPYPPRTKV